MVDMCHIPNQYQGREKKKICESWKEEIEGNDNKKGPKQCQTHRLGLGQCFFIPLCFFDTDKGFYCIYML